MHARYMPRDESWGMDVGYIIHTVDSAAALLNSPRVFPSRYTSPPSSFPFGPF